MDDSATSEVGGLCDSARELPAVPAHRQHYARRDADDERHWRSDTHEWRLREDRASRLRRLRLRTSVFRFVVVRSHGWML